MSFARFMAIMVYAWVALVGPYVVFSLTVNKINEKLDEIKELLQSRRRP